MFKIVIHERVECCSNRFNAFFPPLLLWNAWNHLLIAIDTSIVRDYFFLLWFRLHFFPCLKCLLFFSSPIAINFLQIHNNLKQSMRCDPIQCGRGAKKPKIFSWYVRYRKVSTLWEYPSGYVLHIYRDDLFKWWIFLSHSFFFVLFAHLIAIFHIFYIISDTDLLGIIS